MAPEGSGRKRRLSDDDFRRLAQFRYALRRFFQFSERAAGELGVTGQQYQALLAVRGFPSRSRVTVGELAERLCIRHHSAVGLVDRLVERGLVRRAASHRDRRQVFVEVTAQGERVLEELAGIHRAELKRIRPELRAIVESE